MSNNVLFVSTFWFLLSILSLVPFLPHLSSFVLSIFCQSIFNLYFWKLDSFKSGTLDIKKYILNNNITLF